MSCHQQAKKSFPLGFERCRCKSDMEQRALTVTQLGQMTLLTFFIRRKSKFGFTNKLLKTVLDEP